MRKEMRNYVVQITDNKNVDKYFGSISAVSPIEAVRLIMKGYGYNKVEIKRLRSDVIKLMKDAQFLAQCSLIGGMNGDSNTIYTVKILQR